jgi:hypothetical protein
MDAEKLPDVNFSQWVPWTKRINLDGIDLPGVYLLAHFTDQPPMSLNPHAQEIIYIGETCNQTLRQRWYQFNRCAFHEGRGHSGGIKYRKLFAGRYKDRLYLSAFPVIGLNAELRPLFIRYIERKLILEYALNWDKSPICNMK